MTETYRTAAKFRAYLDQAQAVTLSRWIGCQRFIYNGKVAEDHLFLSQWKLATRDNSTLKVNSPVDQQYSQFKNKELTPWLHEVPSQILRNGSVRWYSGKQRQLKGLAGAPTFRNKSNFNTVLLTKELFKFKDEVDPKSGNTVKTLYIGTHKHSLGKIRFKAHRPFDIPNQITITHAGFDEWYVSFSYEKQQETIQRTPEELAYELEQLDYEVLELRTLALDRNVKDNKFSDSNGVFYDILDIQKTRIHRKAVGKQRQQRRLSRKVKGSSNYRKNSDKVRCKHKYGKHVGKDFAHKTSSNLVNQEVDLFVHENLKVLNMVRRPKAKQDPETGKWLRNGARAKAGLNAAISASCWGSTLQYLKYKAVRKNKVVVGVPAYNSSIECSDCGHTQPENRDKQTFLCQRCGHGTHADKNAPLVLKQRGIKALKAGTFSHAKKKPKRVGFCRKNKTPTECGEVSVEPRKTSSVLSFAPKDAMASKQKSSAATLKPRPLGRGSSRLAVSACTPFVVL